MGVGPKVLTEVFNTIDVDRNGSIDYREFKDAFGEGICGGGYEGMDVFHGEKSHIENIKNRCLRNSPRNMKLETAITELRTRIGSAQRSRQHLEQIRTWQVGEGRTSIAAEKLSLNYAARM